MIELRTKAPGVFVATGNCVYWGKEEIDFVCNQAKLSSLRRARICAHVDDSDPLHEMLIALCADSYVPPHRHIGKSESFSVIMGCAEVVVFHDDGSIDKIVRLSSNVDDGAFFLRLTQGCFHTLVLQSEVFVVKEVTNGPICCNSSEIAPFAPAECNLIEREAYGKYLQQCCRDYEKR